MTWLPSENWMNYLVLIAVVVPNVINSFLRNYYYKWMSIKLVIHLGIIATTLRSSSLNRIIDTLICPALSSALFCYRISNVNWSNCYTHRSCIRQTDPNKADAAAFQTDYSSEAELMMSKRLWPYVSVLKAGTHELRLIF